MFNSIRIKLVIWFLIVFSLVFTSLEVFLYYKLESIIVSTTDDHLRSTIDTIAGLLALEDDHGQLEMELIELAHSAKGDYAEKLSGRYYQVVDSKGEILSRSPSLVLADEKLPVVTNASTSKFETVIGPNGTPIRLVSHSYQFSKGLLTVQAGDSIADTYKLLRSFKKAVIISYPIIFILCGIGTYLITGWALRSIRVFSASIDQITDKDLSTRIDEVNSADELKGLAGSFNTMLKRLEMSFNRQRQFLSDASHELRTPTSIIRSYCDVTLNRERSAEEYKDVLRKISDSVNRMCDIINRILTISRLDNMAVLFRPARVDLKAVVEDVVKLVEPNAATRGVRINMSGNDVIINGDREGLTEMFTNIVENAIKYNKPEGNVDININEVNGSALISVADTGIGIPEEETKKIFDRFYRVDASRGQTIGSGLGLSIVYSIVEFHGGRIEVESTLGKGSIFKVYLPKDYTLLGSNQGSL